MAKRTGADTIGLTLVSPIPAGVIGGDALIEATAGAAVKLIVNGQDADVVWRTDPASGVARALVSGLSLGKNVIDAVRGEQRERLSITSYPLEGPVISGPHMQPWLTTTEQSGLGPPRDAHGNVDPVFSFHYMSKASGKLEDYDHTKPPPADDIATTTTDAGVTMRYIVRRELGAADRGLYELAVLFDPDQPWSALSPQAGWNRKLWIYTYGGWGQGWWQGIFEYQQAPPPAPPQTALQDMGLRRGFMVARTTFLQSVSNSDTVRGAESLMMLKEHITKRYGPIRYTVASGASGGSMMQHMIVNQYPGLLQGIIPLSSLHASWYVPGVIIDSRLLANYFKTISPERWPTAEKRLAVDGHSREETAHFYANVFGGQLFHMIVGGASPFWGTRLPPEQTYDPEKNPRGARGALQEYQVNYLGRRPKSVWTQAEHAAGRGFAELVWENLGVQYGLGALLDGRITVEDFLDLNEKIGGVDIDNNHVDSRNEADPDAVARAHRGGFMNDFRHLDAVPILDIRPPEQTDLPSHTQFHTWIAREGLIAAHGHADNHVAWMMPGALLVGPPPDVAFVLMDRWLSAIEADPSDRPLAEKVVANKPADALDGVYDPAGKRLGDLADYHRLYPSAGDARTVAACGDLLCHRIIKPHLKPLDRTDYPGVTFTEAQWARLQRAFPKGVADWTKPGVGQTPTIPWLDYANGPGGEPLRGA
jgi:hypothetical protein